MTRKKQAIIITILLLVIASTGCISTQNKTEKGIIHITNYTTSYTSALVTIDGENYFFADLRYAEKQDKEITISTQIPHTLTVNIIGDPSCNRTIETDNVFFDIKIYSGGAITIT